EEDAQKWLAQVTNEQPDFSQGSFHMSIQSPRRLTSLADVGLSKAQLVPSCPPTSRLLSCHMVITMKQ
ncbi:hypothetical protein, partial [Segatella oris]|uniref:hypothetical protein n=1 Tax=Segatella oris TaxID=28135 RepID=UPI00360629D5